MITRKKKSNNGNIYDELQIDIGGLVDHMRNSKKGLFSVDLETDDYDSTPWDFDNNEDDVEYYRKKKDKIVVSAKEFEEFAKVAMRELTANKIDIFVLLKNDKLRDWWNGVLKEELAEQLKKEAEERRKQVKEDALAKLSDEEKEVLGLTKRK